MSDPLIATAGLDGRISSLPGKTGTVQVTCQYRAPDSALLTATSMVTFAPPLN